MATTFNFGPQAGTNPTQQVTPNHAATRPQGSNKGAGNVGKIVAIGGISAVLCGGLAYAGMTMLTGNDKPIDETANDELNDTEEGYEDEGAEAVIDQPAEPVEIPEAHMAVSVSDDMPFAEAFAAARAETGAGGMFEWHGNVYATYNADEWNSLSPAEQEAFTASAVGASHHQAVPQEEVEVEGVDDYAFAETAETAETVETAQASGDAEVTIESIVLNEDGSSVAHVSVDNQDVILLDTDNDGVFDVLYTDVNGDGMVDEDELLDITDQDISVNSLGGYTDNPEFIDDDFMAGNDIDVNNFDI